jgi:hypothetical protein
MKIQKVVRTYPKGWTATTERLSELLASGYVVVMCNSTMLQGSTTCLEYIVEKEIEDE